MNKCIYHSPCTDGWCAAYILKKKFPDLELIPMNYGSPLREFSKKDEVIIVDFSFPRAVMEELQSKVASLVCLDHHKTAEAELKGLPYCLFDMKKSGAKLAWEWLYPDTAPPPIVHYVEDRDLWKWSLPNSKEINAAIELYPHTTEDWDELFKKSLPILIAKGKDVLKVKGDYLDRILRNVLNGKDKVGIINSPIFQSEIGNALSGSYDYVMVWYHSEKGVNVSLRSKEFDVSEVAMKLAASMAVFPSIPD